MTYPPTGAWQAPEPPVGDPVYVAEPYPYAPAGYGGYPQPYAYPYPHPHQFAHRQPSPSPVRVCAPLVGYALLAGAVLMVAAAFMPWAQVFGISVDGTQGTGDGNLTIFLGTLVGAMGVVVACMQGRLWVSVVAAVSSALAVVVSFKDIADVNGFANSNGLDPSAVTVGPGLWFTLLAALVALAFAFVGIVKREATAGERAPTN